MPQVLAAVLDEVPEVLPPRRVFAERVVVEHIVHALLGIVQGFPDGYGELRFDVEGAPGHDGVDLYRHVIHDTYVIRTSSKSLSSFSKRHSCNWKPTLG